MDTPWDTNGYKVGFFYATSEIDLVYDYQSGTSLSSQEAEAIKADLKAAGVKVELNPLSWSDLVVGLITGNYQLSQHGWAMGEPPPLDLFWNESSYDTYQWDHGDAYYTDVQTYLNAENQSDAVAPCRDAQEILYQNQPFLTIFSDKTVESYRNDTWGGLITCETGGISTSSYRKMHLKDTTPPSVTILTPSTNANISATSVNISWTRSDNMGLAANTSLRLDGGAWVNTTNNWYALTALPEGHHSVSVLVYDWVNNTVETTVSFTVDATAPTISLDSPQDNANISSTSVTIMWSGSDTTSGIKIFSYRVDAGTWNTTTNDTHIFMLEEGNHIIEVMAHDWANNTDTHSITLTVDATAPTISLDSPQDNTIMNTSGVKISWSGSDSSPGSGIQTYAYQLDGGTWMNITATTHTFTDLADGDHTVHITVYDWAGNKDTASVAFIVDTEDPIVSITSPELGSTIETDTVTVEWSGSDEGSGIDYYEVRIDGQRWETVEGTSYEFTAVSDGEHTIEVRAVDKSGKASTESVTFTVNTSPIGGPGMIQEILIGAGVGVAIAALGVAVYVLRRRKS